MLDQRNKSNTEAVQHAVATLTAERAQPRAAMSAASSSLDWQRLSSRCLRAAVGFWYCVTVAGQLIFAFTLASFYGLTAARGYLTSWNSSMTHGYVPGDGPGNAVVAVHLASAVFIILSGTVQITPWVRNHFGTLHRWNGRLYLVSAFSVSLAGLYMMLVRGTVGGFLAHVGQGIDACLIMVCAVLAARYAMAGEFSTHRRWALRLYLVVSASLFIRAAAFLVSLRIDPGTFQTVMSFAQYVVPLALLELYLRVQSGGNVARRFAVAAALALITTGLAVGVVAVTSGRWLPELRAAYDARRPVGAVLSETIASHGIEEATRQYHQLRVAGSAAYNMDEGQLNTLGYQLIRSGSLREAIQIFQLNVEAFPQSSNTYDSLGEAYMNAGDKDNAVANYRQSLRLNPQNTNGAMMLRRLTSR